MCYQNKEAINERLTYKRKNDNILHALFKSNILIDYNDLLIYGQIVHVRTILHIETLLFDKCTLKFDDIWRCKRSNRKVVINDMLVFLITKF